MPEARRTAEKPNPSPPTDDEWIELQEIISAIGSIPTVWIRVEAFLIARGHDNPEEVIERWRKIAYGDAR